MFGILAFLCIVLGFVVGIFDVHILFEPLVWFVAAIAFELLELPLPAFLARRQQPAQ